MLHGILEFIVFWAKCLWEGSKFVLDAFGAIDLVCALIAAFLYWRKEHHQKWWEEKGEPFVRKYAFFVIGVQFGIAVFFVAPFVQYKEKADTSTQNASLAQTYNDELKHEMSRYEKLQDDYNYVLAGKKPPTQQQVVTPKYLPDKIIPALPESNLVNNANLPTDPVKEVVFVTNAEPDDEENILAEVQEKRVEKQKEMEAQNKIVSAAATQAWDMSLPDFNESLKLLYDILKKQAPKYHDGVAYTQGYFQSIPPKIDLETGIKDYSNIRFQNNTNIAFRIEISELDLSQRRRLTIYCAAGFIRMRYDSDNGFYAQLFSNIFPEINEEKVVQYSESQVLIKHDLEVLVATQLQSSFHSETVSKSGTNTK